MKITENNRPACGIILPALPTAGERFAAEELIWYIKKISGVEICVSDKQENTIVIGEPARNKAAEAVLSQAEFEKEVPGPEGFIIKATERTLLIAGSSRNPGEYERGTLYGVYEFLERFLGCGLSAYSKSGVPAGEFIPQMSDISVPNLTYVKPCANVEYRTAIVQYDEWVGDGNHALNVSFMSWLAKNRYNRILTWWGIYEQYKDNGMLAEAEKRGIMFSVGHHQSINMLLPPMGNQYFDEHYAETHPEFYKKLKNGSRYTVREGDYNGQQILCMRNEELIKQIAHNIIIWSDANPQVNVITLWPHDGKDEQCCCELCSPHSKSSNYSYFVGKIAEIVSSAGTNIKIDRISYMDLTECDGARLSESVILDEAVWHGSIRTGGKPDGSGFINTEFDANILQWKQTGAKVVYYDYLMSIYSNRQKWMPVADEMQAVCRHFCENGIYGLGTQMEVFNIWNNIFNFYSYGRTAYHTDLSFEDNLEAFCRIFGGGAAYIKEIIRQGEKIVDGQGPLNKLSAYLMEHIDKIQIYDLYEKALYAAKDACSRNNIRLMRMVFRYSDLDVQLSDEVKKASELVKAELWYMQQHFDSFVTKKEGFGIAILAVAPKKTDFVPDTWYLFEEP